MKPLHRLFPTLALAVLITLAAPPPAAGAPAGSIDTVCATPGPGTLTQWCLEVTSSAGFTVTASVGSGQGFISPDSQTVSEGGNADFFVIADPDWSVGSISGNTCTPADNGDGTWTAPNITADCNVTVNFVEDGAGESFTVTPSAGIGGTIDPDTPQTVGNGETAQFELRPEEGFDIDGVGGSCGGSLSDDLFTTNPVLDDCTVKASFALREYTVNAQVGEGQGSVDPASQPIAHGQPATVTVSPDEGWRIEEVRGDTCTPIDDGGGQWTAPTITADCQITVDFELITFTVTPTTFGGGGSIAPATPQVVLPGAEVEFELTPSKTQMVDEVTGTCGGTLDGMTFVTEPVSADCTVEGRFRTATFTVTALASGQGTIDPASQTIEYGDSADFTIAAADDWALDGVSGDTCSPVNIGSNTWRAENITADCQVTAVFRALDDAIFEDRFKASD